MTKRELWRAAVGGAVMVACLAVGRPADAKGKKAAPPKPPSANYDELYQHYLDLARNPPVVPAGPGNLWVSNLFGDFRARNTNDLVTIRVSESVSASGSAESNLDKDTQTGASLSKLFGLETKYAGFLDPSSLAALSNKSAFKGSGSTQRQGVLTATLTARVAEVMPNGDLAIEGIRELEINGDRQILVLTGVIRTADVGPGNVVESTAVGQMRIRYFGQGLMRDNLRPGWIARVLNRVF